MNEYRSMDFEKIKVKLWVVWCFLALPPKKSLEAVLYYEMSKSVQYVIIHGQVCIMVPAAIEKWPPNCLTRVKTGWV